ncbi:MAG: hypothetical protein HS111_19580 [Kofleriaceae bacterium]|nr:hypothetical protein [Kofleriaceae bacterium]MCL4228807.1 hypothetical protein [Myxococcales bacterium]
MSAPDDPARPPSIPPAVPAGDVAAPRAPGDLITYLPPRVWYLTSNGDTMWCRRPYGFWFSSSEAAAAFAAAMGTGEELSPIGLDARDLVTEDALGALRELDVTRIFIDPQIDADSGDVHGTILRLEGLN